MEPTLFESPGGGENVRAPLAARMRPQSLDEFFGQKHIIGEGHALRRAIEGDIVPSLILWGPPGTGKTTLAEIVARTTGAQFAQLSAVTAGVADLRKVVAEAKTRRRMGQRTVLFVDEIHRFNKAQQDAVLPFVEDGTITLIGATTENPSFEVNSALLSRSRVFVLHALSDEDIGKIIDRALTDPERGLGKQYLQLEPNAKETLTNLANGDARSALNALEFAAASTQDGHITRELILDAMQRRIALYDKGGDGHYDTISAFIKTMRASDPDSAIYWLARMIDAGEDPLFIARRLVIFASEDVGLADSQAIQIAIAAQQAVHFIGFPEGYYPLAHATLYLANAPKSRTVGDAYSEALTKVQETRNEPVPLELRNAPTQLMKQLGYGRKPKN